MIQLSKEEIARVVDIIIETKQARDKLSSGSPSQKVRYTTQVYDVISAINTMMVDNLTEAQLDAISRNDTTA